MKPALACNEKWSQPLDVFHQFETSATCLNFVDGAGRDLVHHLAQDDAITQHVLVRLRRNLFAQDGLDPVQHLLLLFFAATLKGAKVAHFQISQLTFPEMFINISLSNVPVPLEIESAARWMSQQGYAHSWINYGPPKKIARNEKVNNRLRHSGTFWKIVFDTKSPECSKICWIWVTILRIRQRLPPWREIWKLRDIKSKNKRKLVDFFVWKCRTDEWPPLTEGSPVTSRPFCSCRRARWPTHRRVWNTRGANKNSATRRWNKSKKLARGPSNYSLRSAICSFLTANRIHQATIGVPDTGTFGLNKKTMNSIPAARGAFREWKEFEKFLIFLPLRWKNSARKIRNATDRRTENCSSRCVRPLMMFLAKKKRRAAIFRSDGLRCSMTRTVFQPLFQSLVNFGPSGRQLRPCFGFFLLLLSPQTVPDDIPPASGRLVGSMTSGVTFPPHTLSTNGEIQFQLPAMFQCLLFNWKKF